MKVTLPASQLKWSIEEGQGSLTAYGVRGVKRVRYRGPLC
jgi:hypothetical protein